MVASKDNFPLLTELLADQQRLQTPVARAAQAFDEAVQSRFAELIPLSAPKAGEQYAFEVELDSCTGCKACVSACHSLNGLDEHESWRDVGLVIGGDERKPFQQTVTTACHHCADPACLNGCPVLAYEKDPTTGIVRHLDDQCIGCQYCVLKCPYDVPKYNARLGIVRKCDLCYHRLAAGEAPACAQACPTQAIRVVVVQTAPMSPRAGPRTPSELSPSTNRGDRASAAAPRLNPTEHFLQGAPAPDYTRPTTRYLTRRRQPDDLRAADAAVLRVQPAHWPLAIMLTLLPVAVGLESAALAVRILSADTAVEMCLARAGWVAGALGVLASVAHLGQPLRAWKIFLGWRRSWLSREALLFGAWLGAASVAAWEPAVLSTAMAIGLAGLFCSAMIYVDTRRRYWRFGQTTPRIFGSVVVVGAAALFAAGSKPVAAAWILGLASFVTLALHARTVLPANVDDDAPASAETNTARLLNSRLRPLLGCRVLVSVIATGMLPAMVLAKMLPGWVGFGVLAATVVSEFLDRCLFFRAVDAPKMPGVPA